MRDDWPGHRSQMLKGLLAPCIVAVVAATPAYGYEIVRRLEEAGLADVAEGSIYPALARLERGGLLESYRVESAAGPPRKYYRPTPAGLARLARWQGEWSELASSVSHVLGIGSAAPRREEGRHGRRDRPRAANGATSPEGVRGAA